MISVISPTDLPELAQLIVELPRLLLAQYISVYLIDKYQLFLSSIRIVSYYDNISLRITNTKYVVLFGGYLNFGSLANFIRITKLNVHHLYCKCGFLSIQYTQNCQFKIPPIAEQIAKYSTCQLFHVYGILIMDHCRTSNLTCTY